jgi:hypothetical protein
MTAPGGPGPRAGDDTHDLIDSALAELAERRSAWLGDDLTVITLIASLIDQAGHSARDGDQRPPQRAHLARDCPHDRHQPR